MPARASCVTRGNARDALAPRHATTFVVERRILGHSEMQFWALAFEGKKVAVNFENTDSYKLELHGEAAD